MVRPALVAGTVALVFASAALALPRAQPSERSCLIAWNAPANHANRLKLLSLRPILGLVLRPGIAGTDTWTGTTFTHTSGPVCSMMIMKRGELRTVTGIWKTTRVERWTFARATPATKNYPPEGLANVRLLADGRVTKIYRR